MQENKPNDDQVGLFRMWLFGVKVILAFTIIYLIAWIPVAVIAWLCSVLFGEENMNNSLPGIIFAAAVLFWGPFAIGWLFHNMRDWFDIKPRANG